MFDGHKYRVVYEDGDTEEYDESDLGAIVISLDLAKVQIGSRVAVHWPEDDMYYEATVTRERYATNNLFRLEYDHSDQYEWLDLRHHKFCLLGGGIRRRNYTVVEEENESNSSGDSFGPDKWLRPHKPVKRDESTGSYLRPPGRAPTGREWDEKVGAWRLSISSVAEEPIHSGAVEHESDRDGDSRIGLFSDDDSIDSGNDIFG